MTAPFAGSVRELIGIELIGNPVTDPLNLPLTDVRRHIARFKSKSPRAGTVQPAKAVSAAT